MLARTSIHVAGASRPRLAAALRIRSGSDAGRHYWTVVWNLARAIDSGWGIQVARRIELKAGEASSAHPTEYRKLHGFAGQSCNLDHHADAGT
jgi:hypothetical protein